MALNQIAFNAKKDDQKSTRKYYDIASLMQNNKKKQDQSNVCNNIEIFSIKTFFHAVGISKYPFQLFGMI